MGKVLNRLLATHWALIQYKMSSNEVTIQINYAENDVLIAIHFKKAEHQLSCYFSIQTAIYMWIT